MAEDYTSKTEDELEALKTEKYKAQRALRDEMLAIEEALRPKRAERRTEWADRVKAANGDVDSIDAQVDAVAAAADAAGRQG